MLSSQTGIIATIMMVIGAIVSPWMTFVASIEDNAVFWGLAIPAGSVFIGSCIHLAYRIEKRRHNLAVELEMKRHNREMEKQDKL